MYYDICTIIDQYDVKTVSLDTKKRSQSDDDDDDDVSAADVEVN